MIEILYEDKNVVFCVKPFGLSSETDLPDCLREQLMSEIYTLHRLDKPVSGVMVYAKTRNQRQKYLKKLQSNRILLKPILLFVKVVLTNSKGLWRTFYLRILPKTRAM